MNITNNISQRLKNIGPGSVIAAAFIGPGTVTMCSLAGAKFGYSLIWALLISVLLTLYIQLTAVRIGMRTKKSLSNLIKNQFDNKFLKYCNINDQEFLQICDKWRSDHLWTKKNGKWKLNKQVS